MTTIPFFGFIDYRRQHNIYTEGALSKLSKYFDLSGNRIIVLQDNQVQLKAEETSCKGRRNFLENHCLESCLLCLVTPINSSSFHNIRWTTVLL